ncbi:MAG TPA: RNA polymerase sigma factor [Panacibacter sp.]|nr:RNA polymerase sigma factor [Panacibacter sp.]HNP45494.1 RNA polymerase sigma factor [Panacibacter sp.]
MSEVELIKACLSNDRKAQFVFYRNYFAFISGICMRYLRNEQAARETSNDIFLKIFTRIAQFDASKGSLMAWMKKIAINTCIDKLKPKQTDWQPLPVQELAADTGLIDLDHPGTEDLQKMIRQLPERQSAVLNLFVVEGYSHDEIGAMLGISAGNSRWYLSDAKQRFKKLLTSTGYLA